MDISSQSKLAKNIFRLLKVNEIIFPIGKTPKGNLGIRFADSLEGFEIILDSIPLTISDPLRDDNNIELKRMIEKYWLEGQKEVMSLREASHPVLPPMEEIKNETASGMDTKADAEVLTPKKKGGRPKGSKNKQKEIAGV